MAIKTFTDLTTLPASDINTYLANSGMTYLGAYTANAATLFIDGCFTSAYDNYFITVQTTSVTATGSFQFRLRASGTPDITNYFFGGLQYYTTIAATTTQSGGAADTSMVYSALSGTGNTFTTIYVSTPNVALPTPMIFDFTSSFSNYVGGSIRGLNSNSTAYDGFQITMNTGATIAGTLRVYGIRQA
jgi:hypothetical protein